MARKNQHGKRSDARATATVGAAGWLLATTDRRFVASKRIIEDDHSVTMRYESSYTLGDLARRVVRREREAA